ncbi:MAG: chromosome segregation protein SMC, partial [Smithellaceae bacterium]|nr:chromosome segregation protein SMC [Smithellaceae bacterium]
AKPEDLRLYIEEAAGISKYKGRRESAVRKLEATRQNMVRLNDIIREVKTSLNSTAKQAKRAKQFKELRQEIRKGELLLAWRTYHDLASRRDGLADAIASLKQEEYKSQLQLQVLESAQEDTRLMAQEEEQEISRAQERLFGLKNTINIKEQGIAFARNKVGELTAREGGDREEQEGIAQRKLKITEEVTGLAALIAAGEERIGELKIAVQEREHQIAEARVKATEVQREIEEKRIKCYSAATEKVKLGNMAASLEKAGEEMRRRREAQAREEGEQKNRLRELEERLTELKTGMEEDSCELEEIQEKKRLAQEAEELAADEARELDERLAELKVDKGRTSARFQSLKEFRDRYSFLNEGARSIMMIRKEGERGKLDGFSPLGLMADFMEVPKEYEAAVEIALGEKLQYVAVNSHRDALQAISYLKSNGAGRGSFVTLESKGLVADSPADKGFPDAVRLLDVVGFQEDFRQLGVALLGDVFIIGSLESGLALWKQNGNEYTFVTREGDIVSPHGVLTGGFSGNNQGSILRNRREISELEEGLKVIDREIEDISAERKKVARAIENWQEEKKTARSAQHRLELEINGRKKDLERYGEEWKRLKQRLSVLCHNMDQLSSELEASRVKLEQLQRDIEEKGTEESLLNSELVALKRHGEAIQEGLQDREKDLLEARVLVATSQEQREGNIKTKTRLDEALALLARQGEQKERDIEQNLVTRAELTATILSDEELLRDLHGQYEEAEEILIRVKEKMGRFEEIIRSRQAEIGRVKTGLQELVREINEREIALRELSFQLEGIRNSMAGRYELDLASWAPDEEDAQVESEMLEKEIRNKRDLLENFGEVNLLALEEHETLKERHDFLTGQGEDLKTSVDSLHKTILRINRITRSRFSETFQAINERFQEVFTLLFPGGRGRLLLTDEENLLETGVDMDIQIPGKRLQGLGLLSGGEKTLAAIALIFSILRYRPTPYLILDEVDAALDDANIAIFNRLIRDIALRSQIVMVTHNKLSMEVADNLLGVTMQRKGVSAMISVNLG